MRKRGLLLAAGVAMGKAARDATDAKRTDLSTGIDSDLLAFLPSLVSWRFFLHRRASVAGMGTQTPRIAARGTDARI
jgi:hypothetical protein